MVRPTVARIDRAALKSNYNAIAGFLRAEAQRERRDAPGIIAVVKANAYGHGDVEVARALEASGADLLACADIEEGARLRAAGVDAEILVFGALSVSDLDGLFQYSLTPTISTPGAAKAVHAAAVKRRSTIGYHLKIDTGMNRLGFRHDNLRRTLPEVLASDHLRLEGVFTHFASADEPESPVFNAQRERFDGAYDVVASAFGRKSLKHASNSAALLRDSRVWYDAVRPGLLLYGIVPPPLASTIPLQPVMSLTSRVVAVKGIRPGEGVGYGWRFECETPRTIAVIPAGYADGLDTRLCGRGSVLIRGRRVPIVGAGVEHNGTRRLALRADAAAAVGPYGALGARIAAGAVVKIGSGVISK